MLSRLSTTPLSVLRRTIQFFFFLVLCVNARAQQSGSKTKSAFNAKLINIEAATNETFRYSTTLQNESAEAQVYDLQTSLPAGWMIAYKVDGIPVTSINIEAGKSRDISVEINAAADARPGKYKFQFVPYQARTA